MAAPASSSGPTPAVAASSAPVQATAPTTAAPRTQTKPADAGAAPASDAPASKKPATSRIPPSRPAVAQTSAAANARPLNVKVGYISVQRRALNIQDALSYLDDVKASFTYRPEVYNMFLDIMKEFKCQNIDTPGVIERVSALFRGKPALIRGFNTFLPPGYHIECFPADASSPEGYVVVTTPQGTTRIKPGEPLSTTARPATTAAQRTAPAPATVAAAPGNGRLPKNPKKPESTSAAASAPPPVSARPATQIAAVPRPVVTSAPVASVGDAPSTSAAAATSANTRRQIPEFTHAVDFVNRIKRRFNDQNSTYNKFLRILQTYQIDQKTIQEVHNEVSALFKEAPDLLEDFKQFLPDSSVAGGYFTGESTEGAIQPSPSAPATATAHPPSRAIPRPRPPPQAAPRPPVEPEDQQPAKKRKVPPPTRAKRVVQKPAPPVARAAPVKPYYAKGTANEDEETFQEPHPMVIEESSMRSDHVASQRRVGPGANMHNWPPYGTQDLDNQLQTQVKESPARTPARLSNEESAFFKSLSNYIDDRPTFQEFMKLINLWNQDIIDLFTLVSRARLFLEPYTVLWSEFKNMVGWKDGMQYQGGKVEGGKWIIDNVAAVAYPDVRPNMKNAERAGPSYRKLPKPDTPASCSGRDPLCWDVLNDDWVSQPYAVADDGFLVGRKNEFEAQLHRTEEERYEYDYHIEANLRTIALLEPIAQRLQFMDPQDREVYRLKAGLGGQSKCLYQGIIKKVWGQEAGLHVIQALHDNPVQSVPVVLARLKQKDEDWKRALREWNRVWRDADAKNYYKALDHQGVNIKAVDKKAFTAKAFVAEIETIKQEQQVRRIANGLGSRLIDPPRKQLDFEMGDGDVIFDVVKLFLSYLDRSPNAQAERDAVETFLREFVMLIFCLPSAEVQRMLEPPVRIMADKPDEAASEAGDVASEAGGNASAPEDDIPAPAPARRGGKRVKGQSDLRRKALKKATGPNRRAAMKENDDAGMSIASSRETTPDVDTATSDAGTSDPEALTLATEGGSSHMVIDTVDEPYQKAVPATASGLDAAAGVDLVSVDSALTRIDAAREEDADSNADSVDLPLSQAVGDDTVMSERTLTDPVSADSRDRFNFFCGTSHYVLLRMIQVIYTRLAEVKKASMELGSQEAGAESASEPRYYSALRNIEAFYAGALDNNAFEVSLRKLVGNKAHLLFTIDRNMAAMAKLMLTMTDTSNSSHDKNSQILFFLKADRIRPSTTTTEQINFRNNAVSALGADENLYRVEYISAAKSLGFQLLGKDEIEDEEATMRNYQAYTKSYPLLQETEHMAHLSPTLPALKRNIAHGPAEPSKAIAAASRLEMRFCLRSLRLFFNGGGEDYFFRTRYVDRVDSKPRASFKTWIDSRLEEAKAAEAKAEIDVEMESPNKDAPATFASTTESKVTVS